MTVLRSLMIELGMVDGVSNRLLGIDTQINGIESGVIDTQSGFTGLEKTTKDYGYTAGRAVEDVKKDVEGLNNELDGNIDITKKAADSAKNSWAKVAMIGAGMTAAGAAGTWLLVENAKQAADYEAMSVNFRKNLGENADTMLEEMDRASAGTVSGFEQIKKANYAMTMGIDVETVPAMMEAARAATKRFGGSTDYYFDSIVTGTARQSKLILDNLGIIVDAEEAYDSYAKSINKSTAALTEDERAIAFQQEVMRQAQIMVDETDMATGEYSDELARLSVMQNRLSREIAGTTIPIQSAFLGGLMDVLDVFEGIPEPLKAAVGMFVLLGSGTLATVGSLLTSTASAAMIYSTVTTMELVPSLTAATAGVGAFTTALLTNPITWMVVGIVGLIAVLWLLSDNWDAISGWFAEKWERCSESVAGGMNWIGAVWESTVGKITEGFNWLADHWQYLALLFPVTAPIAAISLISEHWDTISKSIGETWNWLSNLASTAFETITGYIGDGLQKVTDLFWEYHPLGIIIRQWDEITGYLGNIDLIEIGQNIILGLAEGILGAYKPVFEAVLGIGETIVGGIKDFFGIRSPSRLMQETGIAIGDGLVLGLEQSVPTDIPMPEPTTTSESFKFNTSIDDSSIPATIGGEYRPELIQPDIVELTGIITYLGQIIKPFINTLQGYIEYRAIQAEPIIPGSVQVQYENNVTKPEITELTGAITYLSQIVAPVVDTLQGIIQYRTEMEKPDVATAIPSSYESVTEEPEISNLTAAITYLSTVVEPVITNLERIVQYRVELIESPAIPRTPVDYDTQFTEPEIPSLTGAITYLAEIIKPFTETITGVIQYHCETGETLAPTTITAAYEPMVTEPEISSLTAAITYLSTVVEPTIAVLEGIVRYRGESIGAPILTGMMARYDTEIIEPEIAGLTGAITYLSHIVTPVVETLQGIIRYWNETEVPTLPADLSTEYAVTTQLPEIPALTGAITYLSEVIEPIVERLEGIINYRYTTEEFQTPDNVAVEYESMVTGPEISNLTAAITYLSTIIEPSIATLEGIVQYREEYLEAPVPANATVQYGAEFSEPEVTGLTGAITYLSEIIEPIVERLEGIIEYRGIVTEPVIPGSIGRFYESPENQVELISSNQDAATSDMITNPRPTL